MSALDFCMVFGLPTALLFVGILWRIKPPKWKKSKFAYCTPLSCSSQEAWVFAHKTCSHLWVRMGGILLLFVFILLKLWKFQIASSILLWILIGEMILFCCSAFLIDLMLKTNFDHHS